MPAHEVLWKVLMASAAWCLPVIGCGLLYLVSILHRGLRPMRVRLLHATVGMTLIVQSWLFAAEANTHVNKTHVLGTCTEFFVLYTVMFALGPTIAFGAVLVLSAIFESIHRGRSRSATKQGSGARTASTP